MLSCAETVEKLRKQGHPEPREYRSLLLCRDSGIVSALHGAAREVALKRFGNAIYIRGLIEISNICRNDCLYCGIRRSNRNIPRYRLSLEEILQRCRYGYSLGFRTFVLQGGEPPDDSDSFIESLCARIHEEFPDCAITLSLGERRAESYLKFRKAGASRYLLRHETRNPEHYARLHPGEMSLSRRLECLEQLKKSHFQTGTGIMVGSPWQTIDNIVEDILYIAHLRPEMIGIGPFIPHRDTPFATWDKMAEKKLQMTLKLISIFRLMFPDALIPATTALTTIVPEGRKLGILAGANVVMPNLSPARVRENYSLYDGKASQGAESAEGLERLNEELSSIGYRVTVDKGDWASSSVNITQSPFRKT